MKLHFALSQNDLPRNKLQINETKDHLLDIHKTNYMSCLTTTASKKRPDALQWKFDHRFEFDVVRCGCVGA